MDVRISSVGRLHYIPTNFRGTQYQEDGDMFDIGAYVGASEAKRRP